MTRANVPMIERQLRRVRRRLFFQQLLGALVWSWSLAIVGGASWFLAQPFVVQGSAPWLRWTVLGGCLGLATLIALTFVILRRPTAIHTAAALDERCNLKERATTSVFLSPRDKESPAGLALIADVNERVESAPVSEKFPVRLQRSAALVPLLGFGLLLLALYYHPTIKPKDAAADGPLTEDQAVVADIEKEFQKLKKSGVTRQPEENKSAELERLEAELDKLTRQPRDTKEQAREVVKEMSTLEEKIEKREKELADKAQALQAQMKQAERLSQKKDGPAKGLEESLKNADFQKAKDEAEKLAKQLQKDDEIDRLRKKKSDETLTKEERDQINQQVEKLGQEQLTQKDREQLQEQLRDLEGRLERVSRNREKQAEALREMAKKGEISQEELDRELDQLRDSQPLDTETQEQLRKLAQKCAECRKSMQEGKEGEAAKKLDELAKELEAMDCKGEQGQLGDQLAQLRAARRAMCQALDRQSNPASGRRPESAEKPTRHKEERARAPLDKGRLQVIDHVPGGGFKGPRKPTEMAEDIRRAAQEAPEAIDRQRLPRSASDMARGYFEKLRGNEKSAPK